MKVIKNGSTGTAKIIYRKKLSSEAEYRLSLFTYLYSENGRYLVRSTFTGETAELTEQEWNSVQQMKNAPVSYDFIAENGLEQLAMSRIIVETGYDDVKQYQQTVFLMKTMAGNKNGINSYVILPTTGCNARCVYCYEESYAVKTMTPETADRVVDYICETRHDDTVKLRWFGGEPLANAKIISRICSGLRDRGVPYKSSMVTNASLMTKELAHEAKELWNLIGVQVSLDGIKEDYGIRKNYYSPEKHNYDVVMKSIHYLTDEGIKVRCRVNVDMENIGHIPEFLNEMKAEFGGNENVALYLAPLSREQRRERALELLTEILRLTDMQYSMGIRHSFKSSKGAKKDTHIRVNYCMADSMNKSVLITPDGLFNNCEHLPETQTWGNIFDGITDKAKFDELCTAPKVDVKCAECPFLPECTPFFKTGCPGWFEKCREYKGIETEHRLHSLLEGRNNVTDDDDGEI